MVSQMQTLNVLNERWTQYISQKQKDIKKKEELSTSNLTHRHPKSIFRTSLRTSLRTSYLSAMGLYALSLPGTYTPFYLSEQNGSATQTSNPVTKCGMDSSYPFYMFYPISLPTALSYNYGYTDYYSPTLIVQPPSLPAPSTSPPNYLHYTYNPPHYSHVDSQNAACLDDQKENVITEYTDPVSTTYAKRDTNEEEKEYRNMTRIIEEQVQQLLDEEEKEEKEKKDQNTTMEIIKENDNVNEVSNEDSN